MFVFTGTMSVTVLLASTFALCFFFKKVNVSVAHAIAPFWAAPWPRLDSTLKEEEEEAFKC